MDVRERAGKPMEKPRDQTKEYRKDYLDMIAPGIVKFEIDHYIFGNTYRCVWALREYPTRTEEQALLRHLGEKSNVTLHIGTRLVSYQEEKKLLSNATNRNRLRQSSTDNVQDAITAGSNLNDVSAMIASMHRNREPLYHVSVFIELSAPDMNGLKLTQTEVLTELTRGKLNVDRLLLRQQQGFLSVHPAGKNMFGSQYERVLPAGSVANLFPFSYSGRTDSKGFYLGKDKFGSSILVDFNERSEDKTNANILILGNSGQGKSYLLKLIMTCLRESGKRIMILDPEGEYESITKNLGGCYLDLMNGAYRINVLEPKRWSNESETETEAPEAFRTDSLIAGHISFLKDFFRTYRDFTDAQIDTIAIFLERLYEKFHIVEETGETDSAAKYPILSDLYELIHASYENYSKEKNPLYTKSDLQEICLGLHAMAKGNESKIFNGETNIKDDKFLCFGVKGLLDSSRKVKDAMLFNILSYMSHALLTIGNTVACVDELYLFLTNLTAVEYIRNFSKRVRKKESAVVLASQNIEDFDLEGIREYTRPLFSIPSHCFLFYPGNMDASHFMDMLQLEKSEYDLIKYPQRGVCLYKCGNERYNLEVQAPDYKEILFGSTGGR